MAPEEPPELGDTTCTPSPAKAALLWVAGQIAGAAQGREQPGVTQLVSNLAGEGVTCGVPWGGCAPRHAAADPPPAAWPVLHPNVISFPCWCWRCTPLSCAWFLTDNPPLRLVPMRGLKLLLPTQPQGPPRTLLSLPHQLAAGGAGGSCLWVLRSDAVCGNPDAWTKRGLPRYGNSKLLPAGIGTGAPDAFAGVSPGARGCCPSPCSAAGLHHFAVSLWGRGQCPCSTQCPQPRLPVGASSGTTSRPGSPIFQLQEDP